MNPLSHERSESDLYVNEDYRILYEDEWLIAVEKPAPLPVHAVGRFKERNLLSLLKKRGLGDYCSIVNRLDSETSGIVIAAKSSEAAGKIGLQFEKRQVDKEYQAVVLGNFEQERGMIDFPLGMTIENTIRRRVRDPFGESARTDFEVLEQKEGYSLVRIFPQTGRTHQIRAHMAFIGHPVAGDKLYIDSQIFETYVQTGWQEGMRETVKFHRLILHAASLKIRHPQFMDELEFISEFPAELRTFWNELA